MFLDGLLQEVIEDAGFGRLEATGADVERKIKEFGDVLACDGAGENERRPGDEIEIVGDFWCECVACEGIFAFDRIPFADNERKAFACFADDTSEFLVEGDIELIDVHEEETNVGFFDGGEGAKDREFLDTDFLFALAADTGGVDEFDGAAVVFELDAVEVASGAGDICDDGLLFAGEGVEEVAFANVWSADEGDAEDIVGRGIVGFREELGEAVQDIADAGIVFGAGADDIFDAEAAEFIVGECATQVGFVGDEDDGFFATQGFFGDETIFVSRVFGAVDDDEDDVGGFGGFFDLLLDACFEFVVGVFEAGGVDEPEFTGFATVSRL